MKICSLIRLSLARRMLFFMLSVGSVTLLAGCIGSSMSAGERDVHIGIYQNAPKVYLDEAGQPAGLFVELAQEIARLERWKLYYTPCEWEQCLEMLESGKIDLMPDVAFNEERDKRFDFHSVSVAHSWSQVYAPAGSDLRTLADLNGKRVAVLRNSVQESYLRRLMGEIGKRIELMPADTLEQAFNLVLKHQADAVVCNQFYGERHAGQFKLYETPLIFMPSSLFFATGNGRNADLLERIDAHLAGWQQDTRSVYFVALKKAMMPAPGFVLPKWASWALAIGAGLLALFAAMSTLLRWQVNQRTKELRLAAQRLDNVLRASPVVLYALSEDASGLFHTTWVSDNIQQLFGFDAQQALTPEWWLTQLHPDDRPAALAAFRTLSQEGHLTHEYRIIDAQGRVRHVRDEVKYQPKPGGGVATGSWSDLSERYAQAERLSYLLNHDRLTDLANRWLLRDRLEHAIERAQLREKSVAIISIDIDRFKYINDTLGHRAGDTLLLLAVQRMNEVIPLGETLARVGGDDFVLLLEQNVTPLYLNDLANQLLQRFAPPMDIGAHRLIATITLGISLFPEDGNDADVLLKNSELALYEAKKQGGNTFRFFSSSMSAGVLERLMMERDLRGAIQRNELIVYYQPQVDLHSGAWVGAEALVRWQRAETGLTAPDQFIPLAEEIGLMPEMGAWILREACRQMQQWDAAGWRLPRISVNLSTQQIDPEYLVDMVKNCLAQARLDPQRLELEVTESAVMRDPQKAAAILGQLKSMGIQIAIDDFGTGQSSLAYLKRLPLSRLKIDQSFVRDIGHDANNEAISRVVISLAHALGLETVAEGIELEAHAEFLRREGCEVGQGYLFGRPMPADEALKHWQASVASNTHITSS